MSLLSFRSVFRPMFRSRSLLLALFLLPLVHAPAAFAHGSHGGGGSDGVEEGEFDFEKFLEKMGKLTPLAKFDRSKWDLFNYSRG